MKTLNQGIIELEKLQLKSIKLYNNKKLSYSKMFACICICANELRRLRYLRRKFGGEFIEK